MPHGLDTIAERALAISLDPEVYGSFAEIGPAEVRDIMEIAMHNLRDRGRAADVDFLARVDLLSAVKKCCS